MVERGLAGAVQVGRVVDVPLILFDEVLSVICGRSVVNSVTVSNLRAGESEREDEAPDERRELANRQDDAHEPA